VVGEEELESGAGMFMGLDEGIWRDILRRSASCWLQSLMYFCMDSSLDGLPLVE